MAQARKQTTTLKANVPVSDTPVKTIHVAVVIPQHLASWPREKIDVVPILIDYKMGGLKDEAVIDAVGDVKATRKELDKWEKTAVEAVKLRMGTNETGEPIVRFGDRYQATLTSRPRHAISLEKLIAKFGEEALADCYTDTPVNTLNVDPYNKPA